MHARIKFQFLKYFSIKLKKFETFLKSAIQYIEKIFNK